MALFGDDFGGPDRDCDFGRIEQSIVNQAIVDSTVNTIEVLLVQIAGDFKGNAKIVQTRGPFGFIGGDPNDCAFGGQFLFS